MQQTLNSRAFRSFHDSLQYPLSACGAAAKVTLFGLAVLILLAMPGSSWASCSFLKTLWDKSVQALDQTKIDLGKKEEDLRRAAASLKRAESDAEIAFKQSEKMYLEIEKLEAEIEEKDRLIDADKFPDSLRVSALRDSRNDAIVRKHKLEYDMKDLGWHRADVVSKSKDFSYYKSIVDDAKDYLKSAQVEVENSKKDYFRCLREKKASKIRKGPITLEGCRFTQPTLSNYRKGLSGMPNDIPKPPASVFGESYDYSGGKSFHIGSGESAASLKSWYRKQLPDRGWSVLLDDTIKTRFGLFEHLFAKSTKACISVVIANAPAGMSHKSVVAVYTYPGPDAYKPLDGDSGDLPKDAGKPLK